MQLKNLIIFDGSYCLHRALKQQNLWLLRNSELERTGGIFGFLNIFKKEIQLMGNYFPIVCWDDGQSDRRLSIYDNYKKHREKLEDPNNIPFSQMTDEQLDEDYVYNYKLQRKKLIELLNAFGVPNLLFKHTEGDDLMYWLSRHCEKCKVVTDDRDLLQLITENCVIRQAMKDRVVDMKLLKEEYNVDTVDEFIKTKAFLGDGSDNIPSACKGVGEKSVKDFFEVYESLKLQNKIGYFLDEEILKAYCKENGYKFKKAYLNFDENRYLDNLELVDLRKIQDNEINEEGIYDAIRRVYKNKDVHKPLELLNKYEIKTVNTNVIFEAIILARHNIKDN